MQVRGATRPTHQATAGRRRVMHGELQPTRSYSCGPRNILFFLFACYSLCTYFYSFDIRRLLPAMFTFHIRFHYFASVSSNFRLCVFAFYFLDSDCCSVFFSFSVMKFRTCEYTWNLQKSSASKCENRCADWKRIETWSDFSRFRRTVVWISGIAFFYSSVLPAACVKHSCEQLAQSASLKTASCFKSTVRLDYNPPL